MPNIMPLVIVVYWNKFQFAYFSKTQAIFPKSWILSFKSLEFKRSKNDQSQENQPDVGGFCEKNLRFSPFAH